MRRCLTRQRTARARGRQKGNPSSEEIFARLSQQLWPIAGGMVSIAITGGSTVPAFTMQLAAPPMVRLLTINGEAAPTSIIRSDGVHLTWASSGPGSVAFFLYALSGEHPAAVCQFDASAKAGDLPAAVLSHSTPACAPWSFTTWPRKTASRIGKTWVWPTR
jgi:hypothetical protein